MIENGKKYLISTDNWFVAPNGEQYNAVWGKATYTTTKESMGFNPVRSTNWFVKVGESENSILIAGCQIHYAIRTDKKPKLIQGTYQEKDTGQKLAFNKIYIP